MNEEETIKAGKLELHRSAYGTIWFLDVNGNTVKFADEMAANKLFEAIKEGSGNPNPTSRVDGADESHRNLVVSKHQRFATGNGLAAYGLGAMDDDYA